MVEGETRCVDTEKALAWLAAPPQGWKKKIAVRTDDTHAFAHAVARFAALRAGAEELGACVVCERGLGPGWELVIEAGGGGGDRIALTLFGRRVAAVTLLMPYSARGWWPATISGEPLLTPAARWLAALRAGWGGALEARLRRLSAILVARERLEPLLPAVARWAKSTGDDVLARDRIVVRVEPLTPALRRVVLCGAARVQRVSQATAVVLPDGLPLLISPQRFYEPLPSLRASAGTVSAAVSLSGLPEAVCRRLLEGEAIEAAELRAWRTLAALG